MAPGLLQTSKKNWLGFTAQKPNCGSMVEKVSGGRFIVSIFQTPML